MLHVPGNVWFSRNEAQLVEVTERINTHRINRTLLSALAPFQISYNFHNNKKNYVQLTTKNFINTLECSHSLFITAEMLDSFDHQIIFLPIFQINVRSSWLRLVAVPILWNSYPVPDNVELANIVII